MDVELDALDALAARLRALDSAGYAIATEARADVEAAARATAAAGTDPDGKAWAQTKDGERALPNASSAISCVVSGSTQAVLMLVLRAPYKFHQRSKNASPKRGLPRRVILPEPESGVPTPIRDAIARAAARVVARRIGGAS